MAPSAIHVLYVCLERLAPGGAAVTHVIEICEGLRRRGFVVELAARGGAAGGRETGRLRRYADVLLAAAFSLRRADVVYVRSHFAAWPVAVAAALLRRPIVHEVNGVFADAFVTHPRFARLRRLLSGAQGWQYRKASALVAVTPGLAAWARRGAGHDRVRFIGNAANTAVFRPDGERSRRERPYVLFFGGLTRWHGVDTMLGALTRPDWPQGLELVIAGPIVDESLRASVDAAPAGAVYLGLRPQAELPPLIRGAVAALVPISDPAGRSATGVLPLKLFEALACGVPAIVTDLPGQAELVREGDCGLVVPVDDPAALAAAVARLAADPDEAGRLGARGARLVAERHSWDAAAALTADLIENVVRASR